MWKSLFHYAATSIIYEDILHCMEQIIIRNGLKTMVTGLQSNEVIGRGEVQMIGIGSSQHKRVCDSSLVLMISFCTGVDIMARYQLRNNNNNNRESEREKKTDDVISHT